MSVVTCVDRLVSPGTATLGRVVAEGRLIVQNAKSANQAVCGLYVVVCVAGAPMCITVTFFFACGEILGQSDVLIGLSVFLLGLKKKVI